MERTGIFVSHAHEDEQLAQSVRRLLEVALRLAPSDITCTSDADYALERGDDLMEQVRRRLKSAKALFFLATPAAHRKDWVNFECGFAERERDAGHLRFYILTPTSADREAVPLPYKGRIPVTLSNGCDLHAFMKQLRTAFGLPEAVDERYLDALFDLEHRCAALELDASRTARSGELRETDARYQTLAQKTRWSLPLSFVAGVVLAATVSWWQYATLQDRYDANVSRLGREQASALKEELKKLPFAGLIHDGFMHPLRCTTVEALVPDDNGGERTVQEKCDSSGTFMFGGSTLRSDPDQLIRLKVHVGKAGEEEEHTVQVTRSRERLAINVLRVVIP